MAQIKPAEDLQLKVEAEKTQLAADEATLSTESGNGSYWYCLNENHPGAPNFQTSPLSLTRIFQSDKEVPVCPACGEQTNAVPCDGPEIPPESILELQQRFGR